MVKNKNNIFVSVLGIIILLILFVMPKKITLKTLILDKNSNFTNMIIKDNNNEIGFNDKIYIDYTLNKLKNVEVKKVNYDIEKVNKIELRFFSENNPEALSFNIYNGYMEIVSSLEGNYNKNIYEILKIDELNNIIKELER